MPTYQYACTECDHAFEQFQSFSEDSLAVCPQCEGKLRKVFNAVGVVFKGSGFYRTDNRSDAKSPSTAAASTSTGSSDSSSGATKSDSTSAGSSTKSETKAASPAA